MKDDQMNAKDVKKEFQWATQHFVMLLMTAVFSVVTSTAGMYFGYVRNLQEQNESIMAKFRDQAVQHAGEMANVQVEIARLKLELAGRYDKSPEYTLVQILNDMPVPAWCSRYYPDHDEIRMFHVNPRYEIQHGVSLHFYRGNTHANVWPKEFAEIYEEGDRRILESKDGEVVYQPYNVNHPSSRRAYLKWYHETGSGYPMICGAEVHVDEVR